MDRERVRRAFENPVDFGSSPLYRALSATVAGNAELLELASRGRPGQYPTFLFFGAVQHLLRRHADHPLACFYPSIAGDRALRVTGHGDGCPAANTQAGAALVSFCAEHAGELTATIRTRLVQTTQVQRALGLRLGLAAIAADVPGPVHVVEVGASAGLNLRFDRYGYEVGGRHFGDRGSPVQLVADLYGASPLPDLDVQPEVASRLGVDLNPIDILDPDARAWIEALIWPENEGQRVLLSAALALAAADPPDVRRGDAVDVLPEVAATLPAGAPRVVYHAATRMHVPKERRAAFDGAIAALGRTGPLWHLSVEYPPRPDPRPDPSRRGIALRLQPPSGAARTVAVVEAHLRWIETLPLGAG
jgi:hypothetical protein